MTSPLFPDSPTQCRLEVALYQGGMYQGVFKAVVETLNHTQWVLGDITGQDANRYLYYIYYCIYVAIINSRSFPLDGKCIKSL